MPTPKETKLIHTAKRALQMDDDTYRALLQRIAGVESSKNLTPLGVARLIREFERLGFTAAPAKSAGRKTPSVTVDRQALIGKINALLADAVRPWAYADAMAQRMFRVDRVDWLDPEQTQKLVAALSIDARRAGRECDK